MRGRVVFAISLSTLRAGPKAAVDRSPLSFRSGLRGARRFAAYCGTYVVVPKGTGARRPLYLRPWQVELVGTVLDPDPPPSLAGWMLPRGQGKSALVAALGLYDLMLGAEGASVVVVATDERQAGIVFGAAARMVELHPELAARVQVYQDRLVVPARGASFQVLPAVPRRLEGLDPTLAILDEFGVISRDVYEVVSLASGKRDSSLILGIGTPPADSSDSVLADMRGWAAEHPEDETFVWREYSAAGFEDHPVDCRHCWTLANPGPRRLPVRAVHRLVPPAEDPGGDLPPGPAVPVRRGTGRPVATAPRLGRLRRPATDPGRRRGDPRPGRVVLPGRHCAGRG